MQIGEGEKRVVAPTEKQQGFRLGEPTQHFEACICRHGYAILHQGESGRAAPPSLSQASDVLDRALRRHDGEAAVFSLGSRRQACGQSVVVPAGNS